MNSFITPEGRYTNDGTDLAKATQEALRPIVQKYVDMGYSSHDIAYIMNGSVAMEDIYARHVYSRERGLTVTK